MDLIKFKYAMVSVYVISQFMTPASDSLGGLSGNDSIARACFASLDASSGLLFAWATLNFVIHCKSGWFYLPRFSYLHTTNLDEFMSMQLRLSSRTSWKSFFSTSTRVAKLYRIERNNETNEEEEVEQRFCINLSSWIVPYMWYPETIPKKNTVALNRNTVLEAGALSLARLYHFIVISFALFVLRVVLICLFIPPGWQRTIIIFSELGRSTTAISQEISVMTYSCFYKGVHTWPSPQWHHPEKQSDTAEKWEKDFEDRFYKFIRMNFIARINFSVINWTWPYIDRALKGAKLPRIGRRIFSGFNGPKEDEFERWTEAATLLKIDEDNYGGPRELYTFRFERVPKSIYGTWVLGNSLNAEWYLRVFLGALIIAFHLPGLIAPILFSLADLHPLAHVYWVVEQGAVNLLKYYDFCNVRVNTRFGEAPATSIDPECCEEGIVMNELRLHREPGSLEQAAHHEDPTMSGLVPGPSTSRVIPNIENRAKLFNEASQEAVIIQESVESRVS